MDIARRKEGRRKADKNDERKESNEGRISNFC
jgi:hypothetical protein